MSGWVVWCGLAPDWPRLLLLHTRLPPPPPAHLPALQQVDGTSHVVHSEEEALGTRLTIDSRTCLLSNEHDPSKVRGRWEGGCTAAAAAAWMASGQLAGLRFLYFYLPAGAAHTCPPQSTHTDLPAPFTTPQP